MSVGSNMISGSVLHALSCCLVTGLFVCRCFVGKSSVLSIMFQLSLIIFEIFGFLGLNLVPITYRVFNCLCFTSRGSS